jgi:hypothetical protein
VSVKILKNMCDCTMCCRRRNWTVKWVDVTMSLGKPSANDCIKTYSLIESVPNEVLLIILGLNGHLRASLAYTNKFFYDRLARDWMVVYFQREFDWNILSRTCRLYHALYTSKKLCGIYLRNYAAIDRFANRHDSKKSLRLPETKSRFNRFLVHQLCEKLGLDHVTDPRPYEPKSITITKRVPTKNDLRRAAKKKKKVVIPDITIVSSYEGMSPLEFNCLK